MLILTIGCGSWAGHCFHFALKGAGLPAGIDGSPFAAANSQDLLCLYPKRIRDKIKLTRIPPQTILLSGMPEKFFDLIYVSRSHEKYLSEAESLLKPSRELNREKR